MKDLKKTYKKVEKFLGSLKFGITLILIFAVALTMGTFVESYYGTEFANRLVYKSWPFFILQGLMFLCITFATLLRLPPKKRLYGFYTLHIGLLLIFAGAFVTYYAGIDGQMTLYPRTATNEILLPEDQLRIIYHSDDGTKEGKKESYVYPLPSTPFKKNLKVKSADFKLTDYLPYSENKMEWKKNQMKSSMAIPSGEYLLFNENFSQNLNLSLHPDSDFPSNSKLGPLNVHYLPIKLGQCFAKDSPSGTIFWNVETQECFTAEEKKIKIKKTNSGKRFLAFAEEDTVYKFFPDFSPLPLDDELSPIVTSPLRVFGRKLFENAPHLFFFGESIGFFDKEQNKWRLEKLSKEKATPLPWMGFKLMTITYSEDSYPVNIPMYTLPIQKGSELIKGKDRALKVTVNNDELWATTSKPLSINLGANKLTMYLEKKTLKLPFEISLDQFKMDKDPGTERAASFESFVNLFTSQGSEKHHIFMNNPLKHERFTFYQASYFELREGGFGSVLSVNYDPGRPLKYLGSVLLVFGSIWYYLSNRKRWVKKKP